MNREQVIIIGAGPAGLSLGHELESRGIVPLVLERCDSPGASWRSMHEGLKLGPWVSSTLPGGPVSVAWSYRTVPVADYVSYLESYARHNVTRVRTNVEVREIRQTTDGFEVVAIGGVYFCKLLVNATGYFSNPYIPDIPGSNSTNIHQLHSSGYRSAERMTSFVPLPARVLVVGSNLSAGEMIVELTDAGYEVDVSLRGPLDFGRSLSVQRLAAPAYFALENAKVRRNPHLEGDSSRPMDGGKARRLINSGRVTVVPELAVVASEHVEFVHGNQHRYDLIMYATGYQPHLQHLNGFVVKVDEVGYPNLIGMESALTSGLFFLGLDNQRNFRSRFIRGIREDARFLADELSDRLLSIGPNIKRHA